MLEIHNIKKSFGSFNVLDNISINIDEKSITGLAGPSGSGKSTLLRCIQGLELPDSGEIICNKKTTFMFQDFQLFPHMDVLENLTYAPSINNKKNENLKDKAIDLLSKLDIKDKLHSYPIELSGGQKQRVALCRNLMMSSELLLCDEPTSGLDVSTIDEIITLLESVRKLGVDIIIASHDLDFLTNIADRIILLKNGSIIKDIKVNETNEPIKLLRNFY